MSWDQDPQVISPVGRPLSALLEDGPTRQVLDGFESVYRDIVDYIVRCTHRIWEEKNVGLCRTHYSADCELHTPGGPAVGMEQVTQNTIASIASYSDRVVLAEDVIWSEDGPGSFYTSHRIVSRSTHMGDDQVLGPATMRGTGTMTIADCRVEANRIVEEWLVRDNIRALWQVGANPRSIALRQAEGDRQGDQSRHTWRQVNIEQIRLPAGPPVPAGHPAAVPIDMLRRAFANDLFGSAAAVLSPTAEIRWPSNRHGFGRGFWAGCAMQICTMMHNRVFKLQHFASRPLPNNDIAVALRWSVVGHHNGIGAWGVPSGRELLLMAVSHYRLRAGAIVEDVTVFDEVAMLRQAAGGLGA